MQLQLCCDKAVEANKVIDATEANKVNKADKADAY